MLVAAAPNWAEIVTAIGSALGGGTLLVGAFGLGIALSEGRRDRHVKMITDLTARWDEERLVAGREALLSFSKEELAKKIEALSAEPIGSDLNLLLRVPNFLEDIALIFDAGKANLKLVNRSIGSTVTREWDYWKPSIDIIRRRDKVAYTRWEDLVKKLSKFERE